MKKETINVVVLVLVLKEMMEKDQVQMLKDLMLMMNLNPNKKLKNWTMLNKISLFLTKTKLPVTILLLLDIFKPLLTPLLSLRPWKKAMLLLFSRNLLSKPKFPEPLFPGWNSGFTCVTKMKTSFKFSITTTS